MTIGSSVTPERRVLLSIEDTLPSDPRPRYAEHTFELPPGASRISAKVSFGERQLIYVALFDPHEFRGHRMNVGARDGHATELWLTPDAASPGGIAGLLPAGTWRALLNVRRRGDSGRYRLDVVAEFGPVPPAVTVAFPADHVVKPKAGWYKGELHAHSIESDGNVSVATVVDAAQQAGLDFLSLTDHFTSSQWAQLASLANDRTALIRSLELTDIRGHANLHGLQRWVDIFVGRSDWHMNDAADAVHAQGGLFCVNHPFSGTLGWRTEDFDWDKADLLEMYHNLEGPNNNFAPPLWDHHLRLGRRIVGVGGIDSHQPYEGLHRLGQLVTWVYAPELSERGIVEGLRGGRVYVSRGPELRFTAADRRGRRAEMWQTLDRNDGPISFEVQVRSDTALYVFLLKNGYPYEMLSIADNPGEWQSVRFTDQPVQPAYYRVELHTIHKDEQYQGIRWRDWTTTQALSNPIWIE